MKSGLLCGVLACLALNFDFEPPEAPTDTEIAMGRSLLDG